MDIWYSTFKKQLLGSNSVMQVAAQIICKLLLKAKNMPGIQFFLSIFLQIFGNIKKLSGYFSHTEYLLKAQNFSDHFQAVKYVFSKYFFSYFKKNDADLWSA